MKLQYHLSHLLTKSAAIIALSVPATSFADSNIAYMDSCVRFTVISEGTFRMEWQPDGKFMDEPSLLAVKRDYPKADFKIRDEKDSVIIETAKLRLCYKKGGERFTSDNLTIKSVDNLYTWHPGDKQHGNLKGTTRTLDGLNGDVQTQTWCADMNIGERRELENGLLATDGWTLIDDSGNYMFDNTDWKWVSDRTVTNCQDWYFMGYGIDFKSALKDYTLFAGKIPLPPRFAFGYWWSRYWAYSDKELNDLVDKFDSYDIPLDVLVVDMDWHYTDEKRGGWTGWTWNKSLFPNPTKFISRLHDKNIKITLNLHPADGFETFEEVYPVLARHLGKSNHEKVDWINSDKATISAIFENVIHPMERTGVDFWWLDWQQAIHDRIKTRLNNTWWINYCFFSDMERHGTRRPMLYHRWGGLGNHRYQVGFSGDAVISWKSLDYQPYFTATASNVLYGYWSHDIGGHLSNGNGIEPEMYVRWLQFGALSPIMRTHSCKNSSLNKEPWIFDDEYRDIIRKTIKQRYIMVPYIYTMARQAYDTGVSLCRPMYYDYPETKEAYEYNRQYMFGDNILVAPVTRPSKAGYTSVDIWLPEGEWYELHSGTLLQGGKKYTRSFALDEYGIYVKSGAILPMYPDNVNRLDNNPEKLILTVFPGKGGKFNIYEDSGNDKFYSTRYAVTGISSSYSADSHHVIIGKREGEYPGMQDTRDISIKFMCVVPPEKVVVNGKDYSWDYLGDELALEINLGKIDCDSIQEIKISYPKTSIDLTDGTIGKMRRIAKAVNFIKFNGCDTHADELASLGTITEAISYSPENIIEQIASFNEKYTMLPEVLRRQSMSSEISAKFLQKAGWE